VAVLLFFQEGGADNTILRQVTALILAESNCASFPTFNERKICAAVIYGDEGS
jgi:hypothetical protein